MPINFKELSDGIENVKLHNKIWKTGTIYQKGGDINV
jgi:hypothetical protein